MEKKKRIYLTIVVVITLAILSGVTYLLIQRKNTVNQIEKIVENCAKNKIDNKFISNIDGEKIYYSIQNNWTEEGGINLKKVESYTEKKNWSKKYICIKIDYKGTLNNEQNNEDCEYYKIYFKKNDNGIYITKVGVSVGETGVYSYEPVSGIDE